MATASFSQTENDVQTSALQWCRSADIVQSPSQVIAAETTAEIVASLGMAEDSILTGFLQAFCPLDNDQLKGLEEAFGTASVNMLKGVIRIDQLSAFSRNPAAGQSADPSANEENLRKMLITMVDDVRVVLIKLASMLSQLRLAKSLPANDQVQLARITQDIYAPLANRLGVWQLKWEMEDFILRYLQPRSYQELASRLQEKRVVREAYIDQYIAGLRKSLSEAGIENEVYGRPKHLYSIWKKMQKKGLAFENLWDIRAVRILVNDLADCYAALGVVHTQWRHLPGEFDDYIATPKGNGYRSIHTVVIGPEGKSVEVQIRTREMHEENELGVAAHWRYKENTSEDTVIDSKVLWLRQLLEWKDQVADGAELAEEFIRSVTEKRVYVFTPNGKVIDLPHGSTPIDFAYAIHSEVGNRTRGARVNAKMVSLAHVLKTGDQVQIQTAKNATPSRDWLRADLGYVKTSRARNRIQHWFKQGDHDHNVSVGRTMLEKELHRLGLNDLNYERIAEETHFHKVDDLLAALGANDFKLSKALGPFKPSAPPVEPVVKSKPVGNRRRPQGFNIQGVGNLLTNLAKCCGPVPGEQIVGFITQGRGVSVHRQNCNNITNLPTEQQNRLIEVEWGEQSLESYAVDLEIQAYHRSGLLHDVTQTLKDNHTDVLLLNMSTDAEHIARVDLRIEISGSQDLNRVINQIRQIQNVLSVRRANQ
ncbi:MAG: bifunctional (p)ppGpp synthetase/guanosine-3',5'-bis(diphosphate) 3'-pyrophosphohydrolase [Pseudomonadota bacterium]